MEDVQENEKEVILSDNIDEAASVRKNYTYKAVLLQLLDTWKMIKEGFIVLYQDKYLFIMANAKAFSGLIWGGQDIINLTSASIKFKIGDDSALSIGLLFGSLGIATGAAPIIIAKILKDTPQNSERALIIGFTFLCVGSFLLVWTPTLWLWILFNVIRSAGSGIIW